MLDKTLFKSSNNIYKYRIEEAKQLPNKRCLIVGLFSMKEKNIVTHLANVKSVIEENSGIVVGSLIQRRGVSRAKKVGGMKKLEKPMSPSTYLGKGKAQELAKLSKLTEAQKIVFFHKLSDGQKRNLFEMTNCQIIECEIIKNNE